MGIAFQLKDDFLDVFGSPKVFGKQLGGDILANKKGTGINNLFFLISASNFSRIDLNVIVSGPIHSIILEVIFFEIQ